MSDTVNPKLPIGLQLEMQQLQQKQALANALMTRSLTPVQGQMVGPHYASGGALSSIGGPVIEALMAKKMMDRNAELSSGIADKYRGQENRMTPKDIFAVPGASLESRRQAALANNGEGDTSLLTPDQREHVVNGQVVTSTPGQPTQAVGDFRDRFGNLQTVGKNPDGTPIQAQINPATNENKYSPSGGVKVNIDTTQKAGDKFATELAGKRADVLAKSYDNAVAAGKAYDAVTEAKKDLDAGMMSGSTANFALGVTKFAKALGLPADPAIVNTEAFRSNMARETLNLVKNLGAGTGISNADRDFAEKAAGGDITLDNGSIYRLMSIAAAASGNVLVQHDRLLQSNQGATGSIPADLETFKVPWTIATSKSGTPGGLHFDENQMRFGTNQVTSAGAAAPAAAPIDAREWLRKRQGSR